MSKQAVMCPPPTVVDLFSGCGGMSLGFEQAGYQLKAAFDSWQPAIDVYNANFSHKAFRHDLSDVDSSVSAIAKFDPDVIIGGPPCQDFSTAGKMDEHGGRAALSVKFAEIVHRVNPKWFVMENVSTAKNSTTFNESLRLFRLAGYGLTQIVLDAAHCGVPQTRKRMFVIGGKEEEDQFLSESLESDLSHEPLSIRDYMGDKINIDHYFRVPTNYSRRGVFSVDEPSMTIRGVERPIPPGYKGHPKDSAPVAAVRPLTVKERSRLQTFPERFTFTGAISVQNQMIGNAVPVNLAKYVAQRLLLRIHERTLCAA